MATMKMTGCMALVAKMPQADQDALLERLDQYQADGIPAERAQTMAARDMLAEIQAERTQIFDAIAKQYPDLLEVAEAPAATLSRTRAEQAENDYTKVREKYLGTSEWLKAPNGQPTNLTDRQWVQVRTPQFKAWFGDWEKFAGMQGGVWNDDKNEVSKVVDENGEPLVVYHGTDEGGFSIFKEPSGTKRGDLGIFATPNRSMAATYVKRGRAGREIEFDNMEREPLNVGENVERQSGIYGSFMNLRNPQEEDFRGAMWNGEHEQPLYQLLDENGDMLGEYVYTEQDAQRAVEDGRATDYSVESYLGMDTDSVVRDARKYRNDGVIIRNVIDDGGGASSYASEPSDVFVAFKPNQLKSATQNTGEFGTDTNDLRFSPQREEVERNADAIAAMDVDTRDNTELGDFPGGPEAYNLYEARKLLKKPSDKLKRVTDSNTFSLWQNYDFIANVDGELFGVTKQEDPDEVDDETKFIYSFENLADGTSKDTVTDQTDELFREMRASIGDATMSRERAPLSETITELAQLNPSRRSFLQTMVGLAGAAVLPTRPAFAADMTALLRQGKLAEAVDTIAASSGNRTYRQIAGLLKNLSLDAVQLRVIDPGKSYPGGIPGALNYAYGLARLDRAGRKVTVFLRGDKGLTEETVLHESIHAALMQRYDQLNYYLANPQLQGKKADPALKLYSEVFQEFRDAAKAEVNDKSPTWLTEPFGSPDEFISYALTSPELQKWMEGKKYQGKTLWGKFKEFVRAVLGIGGTNPTWLDAALKVSTNVLESAAQDAGDFAVPDRLLKMSKGASGASSQRITSSRQRIVGDSGRTYTPEQKAYFDRVGRTVETPTIKERLLELRKDLGKKLAQGVADQFRPLRELGGQAYALARLSRGATGAFDAMLNYGKLSLKDGVYDADQSGGFLERVGKPLHGELEDFLWWVAANRAERLASEGRENLFEPQDIAAGKSLDNGTTNWDYTLQHDTAGKKAGTVTRDRTLIYRDALKSFDEFNKNAMDMAEQSGLIDAETRPYWENEFYVPFYRVTDDNGGFAGGQIKKALVRQEAFKRLKGGKEKLNSDLLQNTLMNWGHLIDAAAKNRAAKASLESAQALGVAIEADESTAKQMAKAAGKSNHAVWFMDQGVKRYFVVEDPMVMAAISSLEYAGLRGPVMDALSKPKHWLTIGVTASPHFKIKNLIRDSLQAVATAPLSYNPLGNVVEGFKASNRESQDYVSALASGALIRFGTMLEGNQAEHTRRLIKSGVKDSTILDSEAKVRAMYDKFLAPGIEAYNELGNRGEEINRMALFKQLRDQGVPLDQAALMARDLMDFSMQGTWTAVRFLTQVVPFMNARIQGLYKLGRAGAEDPKRFGVVLAAVAAASLALMLAYEDDDDWKKREDWDRNNNWWFKIGGTAFRIPKPFEIGAMATLAERTWERFFNPEMTGKRYYNNVKALVLDSLSMNPVPQLVKPLVDLYANKNSFTGRPIETLGMERLKPQYRYTSGTSMAARALSTGTLGALSPVQYDHLIQGYFAWMGTMAVTLADVLARPATGQPTRPTADAWKIATGGMVSDVNSASSRYVSQMYEQAQELEQAMGTYRMLLKTGRKEEAREFFQANKADIIKYGSVEKVKAAETRYNEMIRMVERSSLDPDIKRERIQKLQAQKDKIARVVAPGYKRQAVPQ